MLTALFLRQLILGYACEDFFFKSPNFDHELFFSRDIQSILAVELKTKLHLIWVFDTIDTGT